MTLETLLTWMVVGLIAGWLASTLVGGGRGLVGDIVVGVIGAFIGGMLFREMHWHAPFQGLAGVVFVAFVGAAILLASLRVLRRGRAR